MSYFIRHTNLGKKFVEVASLAATHELVTLDPQGSEFVPPGGYNVDPKQSWDILVIDPKAEVASPKRMREIRDKRGQRDRRARAPSLQTNCAWFFVNARNTASITLHERLASAFLLSPGPTFAGGEGILFRLLDQRT